MDKPYSKESSPTVDSTTDKKSNFVRLKLSVFFNTTADTKTIASASTATTTNIARQPIESIKRPEREGPIAGAKPIKSPIMPMADPRFSRGNIKRIVLMTMGITAPVAAACITRPASNNGNAGLNAANTLPAQKSPMPPMYNWRVVKRPIIYAASGITTASVRAYPLVSH